jgi:hypothetical protein
MRLPLLAATLIVLTSARATAGADTDFASRPNALYAQVGAGTPLGYVGLELARRLWPSFQISAGAGMGVSGPQIALMPRLLFGHGRSVLVVGAGLSRGKYKSNGTCYELSHDDLTCAHLTGTANWANAEIGGEYRWINGISFRYFGGYGRAFAGDLVCAGNAIDQCNADPNPGRTLIYTGFALGQAF